MNSIHLKSDHTRLRQVAHLPDVRAMYFDPASCAPPSLRVQNCGMNFEWSLFEFTRADCQLLSQAVQATPTLRVLRLQQSKVNDERGRLLVSKLLDHPSLATLGK